MCKLALERAFNLLVKIRLRQPHLYSQICAEKLKLHKTPSDAQVRDFLVQNSKYIYYPDFVRFLIYLENPDLDVSVDFWFEVADLDADGYITLTDFDQFYDQLKVKLEASGIESIDARDLYCQILDFYKSKRAPGPRRPELASVSLADIRKSQARGNIFSVMFHSQRFQAFDMKDPYTIRTFGAPEKTMWERFCRRQYDIQVQGV